MCDDVAIRWSEYEGARRQIREEAQREIVSALDKYIWEYQTRQTNNHFLAGLEVAKSVAEDPSKVLGRSDTDLDQPSLF